MIHLQYTGLLLACIGGSVFAGLLPDGGANGYQYNRPSGQDFGGGRGFGDRFGNRINDGGLGGDGFIGRPTGTYGAPNFGGNGALGGAGNAVGGGYNSGSGAGGFGNRVPSGNYGAPGAFGGGGLQGGYQQQPGSGFGGGPGYQGSGGDGYYQGGRGGGRDGGRDGFNGDNGRPQPYSFQYEVRDPPSGNDYAQQESSDGNVVRGEYRVLLPDSRTQIVKYTADDVNGYNADVQYEGQAQQFSRGGGYNQFGGPGDAGYQGGFGAANNYQGGRAGYGNGGGGFGGGIFPTGGGVGGGGGGGSNEAGGNSNRYLPPSTGGYGK